MRITLFLLAISLSTLFAESSIFQRNTTEQPKGIDNQKMCRLFTQKAADYEKTMRDDAYAKATLASYKKRAALYCDK